MRLGDHKPQWLKEKEPEKCKFRIQIEMEISPWITTFIWSSMLVCWWHGDSLITLWLYLGRSPQPLLNVPVIREISSVGLVIMEWNDPKWAINYSCNVLISAWLWMALFSSQKTKTYYQGAQEGIHSNDILIDCLNILGQMKKKRV